MEHTNMSSHGTERRLRARPVAFAIVTLASALASLGLGACGKLERCLPGTNGCIADHTDVVPCEPGTRETADEFCTDEVFYDACSYRADGHCDDGSTGSEDAFCQYGADFSDCGYRANPCATNLANPVYCPQTPNRCWPTTVDCNTVRYCTPGNEASAKACSTGEMVDCTSLVLADTCKPTNCPDPNKPVQCFGVAGCFGPMIDCNTVTTCGSFLVACFTGEQVVCGTGGSAPSCMLQ